MTDDRTKYNISDTTFIIPFMIDHPDRLENLKCILNFLDNNFVTNFILVESVTQTDRNDFLNETPKNVQYLFTPVENNLFHRTQQINLGIKLSTTPYISIYDADVILSPKSIFLAVEALRKGATLSYPFDGTFVDINRSYINDGEIKPIGESHVTGSFGGACFLNREDYIKCGMENENFKSHCPDDIERMTRVKTIGYAVQRTEGKCYHITHWRGENSGGGKYTEANNAEWNKVKNMSKYELLNYVKSWEWAK